MTGEELLALARKGRPEVRYELHKDGHTIAAWSESLGRFCAVAMLTMGTIYLRAPCAEILRERGKPE